MKHTHRVITSYQQCLSPFSSHSLLPTLITFITFNMGFPCFMLWITLSLLNLKPWEYWRLHAAIASLWTLWNAYRSYIRAQLIKIYELSRLYLLYCTIYYIVNCQLSKRNCCWSLIYWVYKTKCQKFFRYLGIFWDPYCVKYWWLAQVMNAVVCLPGQ